MKEIELKILNINPQEIKKKLIAWGAKKTFEGTIESMSLDFPDERIRKSDRLLRLRRLTNEEVSKEKDESEYTVELCFKDKKEKSRLKIQEETQVITSNFKDTLKILTKIGLIISRRRMKVRESYQINNTKFEFDYATGIPTFMEIESSSEREVKEWVKKLGYTMSQTTNMTFAKLEEHYRNKKKKDKKNYKKNINN